MYFHCFSFIVLFCHLFLLSLSNFGTLADGIGTDKHLKLCINYQSGKQNTRKTKIHLTFLNMDELHNNIVPPRQIINGENFELAIPNAEKIVRFELVFECQVAPLADEMVPPPTNHSDQSAQNDQHNSTELRSLIRTIRVHIFKPDFSKIYHINLGSIKLSDLFWHRRVFVETDNNGNDGSIGNYHAFLYAKIQENKATHQSGADHTDQNNEHNANDGPSSNLAPTDQHRSLLGYAPLVMKEMIQREVVKDGTDESSEQKYNVYELQIPVKLSHLFRHKIEWLELSLLRHDECKCSGTKPEAGTINDDECLICLDPLENGEKKAHPKCVKEWYETKKKIVCIVCHNDAKPFLTLNFQPIFYESEKEAAHLYMNPLKELFQISKTKPNDNDQMLSPFQHEQAKQSIVQISTEVQSKDLLLKEMLTKFGLENLEMALFSIDQEGQFAMAPMLDYISAYINQLGDERDFKTEYETESLALIQQVPKQAMVEAAKAIDQMQIVDEKDVKAKQQLNQQSTQKQEEKEKRPQNFAMAFKNLFIKTP